MKCALPTDMGRLRIYFTGICPPIALKAYTKGMHFFPGFLIITCSMEYLHVFIYRTTSLTICGGHSVQDQRMGNWPCKLKSIHGFRLHKFLRFSLTIFRLILQRYDGTARWFRCGCCYCWDVVCRDC